MHLIIDCVENPTEYIFFIDVLKVLVRLILLTSSPTQRCLCTVFNRNLLRFTAKCIVYGFYYDVCFFKKYFVPVNVIKMFLLDEFMLKFCLILNLNL